MTIQNIINRINKEAQEKADEILSQAKSRCARRIEDAKRDRHYLLDQHRLQAEKEQTITRNIHISEARRDGRRAVLEAKEAVITECFRIAREKLVKLTGKPYEQFLKQKLETGLKMIDGQILVIPARKEDTALLGAHPRVTVAERTVDKLGGMILQSTDGKITIDFTFEGILTRKMNSIRTEVARILFTQKTEEEDNGAKEKQKK